MAQFLKNILSTVIGTFVASILTIFVILGIIGIAMTTASRGDGSGAIDDKSILHIRLRGTLVDRHKPLDFDIFGRSSIFGEDRTQGLWELTRAIEAAKTDKRISGIYLEVRDFDAGWANLSTLRRKIDEFKATGKWVYSYADRLDEAGYYIASVANETFLQPNGEIEFNGLGVNEAFLKGLFEKLEIQPQVFRVGKFKAAVEPFILDKMSDENREQTRALVDDVWAVVRKSTSVSRKMDEKKVDEIASNLSAKSALEAQEQGLVGELIFEDALESRMANFTVGPDDDIRFVSPGQLLRDRKAKDLLKGAGKKKIALVFAEGEIGSGPGSNDSIGSEGLREDLLDVEADEDVAAVVLRVNSPGGDALASDVIWRAIMVLDERIPVIVSMGDVAASGGYYMAAGGRYVFAESTTITGSIGVFGLLFNTQKLFNNKAGVKFDRVVTHPFADIGDPNRPMTSFETQVIQSEVERVYKRFIDVVQEGRGYKNREDIERIAEGRVWSGSQAKELGLVDELGGIDQAIKKAAEYANLGDEYSIEVFPKDGDPLSQLLSKFASDSVESALGRETLAKVKAVSRAVPDVASKMKTGIYARVFSDLRIR